jgi:uncharacterized protein (DUF302 family)
MKQLRHIFVIFAVLFITTSASSNDTLIVGENKNLAVMYEFDDIIDERFEQFIQKDLKKIGYYLNDPHRRVNDAYKNEYGSTYLDLLSFSSILNENSVRPLLNEDPRLGAFNPFNLLIFRKKDEKKTVVAHLTPEAVLDLSGIHDPSIRKIYTQSFESLDQLISEKLGGTKKYLKLHGYTDQSIMNFEIPVGEPEDIDDFLDEFQEKFETAFEKKGYVMAGFYNIKESYNSNEDQMPAYQSYWSYDLCHIPFSYALFDGVNGIPEAGVFAPCSMYVYLKEGSNKLVIGMPRMHTWGAALGIIDEERLRLIRLIDKEIPEIIESLGGYSIKSESLRPKK